jgi:hypothetical protein
VSWLAAPVARAAYSPATTSGWFLVAGRVPGFGGAQFRTDIWLFNPDSVNTAVVTLTFHGQVASGGGAPAPSSSAPITLAPRETSYLADVLLTTVPADGQVGALEWSSNIPVMGGLRSYTVPSGCTGGTFGAFQPGLPTAEAMTPKQSALDSANVLQMFGTNSGEADYRTQLDVTNTSPVSGRSRCARSIPVTRHLWRHAELHDRLQVAPAGRPGHRKRRRAAHQRLRITVATGEGTSVPSGGGSRSLP